MAEPPITRLTMGHLELLVTTAGAAAGTAVMEGATVAHLRRLGAHATAVPEARHRPVQDCLQDLRRARLCIQSGRRLLRRRSTPSISGMVSRLFLRHRLP
jgi:hypothetical protein